MTSKSMPIFGSAHMQHVSHKKLLHISFCYSEHSSVCYNFVGNNFRPAVLLSRSQKRCHKKLSKMPQSWRLNILGALDNGYHILGYVAELSVSVNIERVPKVLFATHCF